MLGPGDSDSSPSVWGVIRGLCPGLGEQRERDSGSEAAAGLSPARLGAAQHLPRGTCRAVGQMSEQQKVGD